MKFFSGFCLHDEKELFDEWIEKNDFCVAGFSYGAIKAFEYASTCKQRIDKLQLFSPAFFQDRSDKFKRMQTLYFSKDKNRYVKEFLEKTIYPSDFDIKAYFKEGTLEELKELLNYKWSTEKIKVLKKRGLEIEVYLGEKDKIINPNSALDFFLPFADVYYMKDVGHMLK